MSKFCSSCVLAILLLTAIGLSPAYAKSGNEIGQQNQKRISGVIVDRANLSVIGASVLVKGTTNGTVTDIDGKFSLEVADSDILVVSFIGYVTKEIPVGQQTTIDIILEEDTRLIEEVVVVGYGTQKKINLTGAVDVISNERLADRQAPTVSQMLQGVAPGFNFSIDGQGGFQPGANMKMTIRGMGSLNGGSPYILIDGFPGDINNLNVEDVESISVLKDAAASAIYGARAAYGVVLVTTKTGKKNEKLSVTYAGNIMINTPQKLPQSLDSYTWTRIQNEAGDNMGGRPFSNATIDRVIAFQNQDWDYLRNSMPDWPEGATNFGAFPQGNVWNAANLNYADTDWWDIYFGSSVNQKHDVSLQGGTDKASYYFSAGYIGQEGVVNFGKDLFERINVMGKVDLQIAKWWDFSWESRFAKKYREMPNMTKEGDYSFLYRHLSRNYPITPLYDGWGNYSFESHIPSMEAGTDRIDEFDTWNNFKMELRPLKGWKINADFAYNSYAAQRSDVEKYIYIHNVDNTVSPNGVSIPNNIERTNTQNWYWTTNLYTSYVFDIQDKHNFSIMAGMQFEKGRNTWLRGYKTDMLVESVPSFQTSVGSSVLTEELRHNATEGYFARFSYNFQEKYLFETNMRYDGSYVFRKDNRWGFFPSFSAGWNVHKEAFWEGISNYVNTFRLKGSWGQLGNQNVDPYTDLELIPMESGKLGWLFDYGQPRSTGYTKAPDIVNRNLTWETVTTTNAGADMSFLDNRLQATFDWFERLTTDMVGPSEAKPGVLGADVPKANNSTLRTRGWELSLNWKQAFDNGFSYFVSANLYDYKSVVTKYHNPTGTLSTWYAGKEAGEIWGYTVNDLFRNQADLDSYLASTDLSHLGTTWRTGDLRFEDTNHDGKVNNGKNTVDDHGDMSVIGNSEPHFQYGFTVGASYKGIDFSMLWRGVAKKDMYFYRMSNIYWGFTNGWWESCLTPDHLDYFRDTPGTTYSGLYEGDANINTDAYWPRPYLNSEQETKNKNNANTRYLVNAAYLRMQNIQIGYTLPRSLTSKMYLERVRVYFSGENLLTFSKLPDGLDPVAPIGFGEGGSGSYFGTEGSGRLTYGADRVYSFGINITY